MISSKNKNIIIVIGFILFFMPSYADSINGLKKLGIKEIEIRYKFSMADNIMIITFKNDSAFIKLLFTEETSTLYNPFNRSIALDNDLGDDLFNRIDSLFISKTSIVCEKIVAKESGIMCGYPNFFSVYVKYLNGKIYRDSFILSGLFDKNSKLSFYRVFSNTFESFMSILDHIARNNGLQNMKKKIVIKRKLKNGTIPYLNVPRNSEIIIKR